MEGPLDTPEDEAIAAEPAERWDGLPHLVLVNVFGYLGPRERLAAGRQCRQWLQALAAAPLWRSVRVLLSEASEVAEVAEARGHQGQGPGQGGWDGGPGTAAVLASPRYAPLVRQLELSWSRACPATPTASTTRSPLGRLGPTLQLLDAMNAAGHAGHLQLKCLQLHNFTVGLRSCRSPTQRGQLLAALAAFVGRKLSCAHTVALRWPGAVAGDRSSSQRQLESLSLENACLAVPEALRLLGAASWSSGLADLNLRAAFREWQAPHSSPRFCWALRRLCPLSSLHLDFPALSDATLALLAECCPSLRALAVTVRAADRRHTLSQEAWQRLATACPRLRAAFNVENLGHYEDICGLLLPGVPLHGFRLYSGRVWDQTRSRAFRATLRLLVANYQQSLEVLQLCVKNNREELDDVILDLLSRCGRLAFFQFDGVLRRMGTVGRICSLRLADTIRFRSIAVRPKTSGRAVRDAVRDITAAFREPLAAKTVDFHIDVPKPRWPQ